jgi:hypothetical protein
MLVNQRLFASLCAVVIAANCKCGEDLVDTPEPKIELRDRAGNTDVTSSPWLTLNLGDADTGQTVGTTLTIANVGTGQLTLTQACLVAAADLATALRPDNPCVRTSPFSFGQVDGAEIASDETLEVAITFTPQSGGPSSLFMRVTSNDADRPITAAQLTGRGTDGKLCIAEPFQEGVVDFGEVALGTTEAREVRLYNCGVRPITVDTLGFVQNPDGVFTYTVQGAVAAAPFGPLNANDGVVLDVTFTPSTATIYRDARAGNIGATVAAPYAAQGNVFLVGSGRAPPSCQVQVFPEIMNFGAVAANGTQTRDLIVQSVGQCACTVTALSGPTPGDVGFSVTTPALPVLLRGTLSTSDSPCDTDPAGAATAEATLVVPVTYTAPDRATPTVDRATIDVTSDAPLEPTQTVQLEANGGGTPFCQLDVSPQQTPGFNPFGQTRGRWGVVEFGRTSVNIPKRLPITFTNIGNTNCSISGVVYDDEGNTLENEFTLESDAGGAGVGTTATIAPGDTVTYQAVFSPTRTLSSDGILDVFAFGSYGGSLGASGLFCTLQGKQCNGVTFTTNDTTTDVSETDQEPGVFSIGFAGTPVEPSVDVIPASLDFGVVTLGCGSPEQRTTMYNTGATSLMVGQPVVDPAVTPAEFVVVATSNPTGTWPYSLLPGSSLSTQVRYYARAVGVQTATLVIPTFELDQNGNSVAGPPITVPLRGEGTTERSQTDIFDQANEPMSDVLFVVDDSGSMSDDIAQLSNNFPRFFSDSNIANTDYHIAVTTTLTVGDGCAANPFCNTDADCGPGGQCTAGLCVAGGNGASCEDHEMAGHYTAAGNNPRFVTRASANPQAEFQANVDVAGGGANPSRPTSDTAEAGLRGAYKFLSAPKIDDPAINGGFLRDAAKLHVIIVSDEVDQSRGPTDLYIDFFRNLKGFRNEGLVAVSAIAKRAGETCSPDDSDSGNARYSEVVDAMGGRFQSLCDPDWSSTMASLGLDSLGLQVEFFLTRAAEAASLNVCVRATAAATTCTPVTQTTEGANNGYFFDPLSNSIVFNPGSVPPRGARVEARYETICYP